MAEKGFGVKEVNLIGASGTPTITSPNNLNLNANNVAISTNVSIGGTLSVTGNVSVGGTLTYEDVTNIDSVGIVTARAGVVVGDTSNTTFRVHRIQGASATNCGLALNSGGSLNLFTDSSGAGTSRISISNTGNIQFGTIGSIQFLLEDYVTHAGDTNTQYGFDGADSYVVKTGGSTRLTVNNSGANVVGALTVNGSALSIDPTATDVQVAYELLSTSASGAGWRITGNGIVNTVNNPDLYLIRGQKYRFINNSGGSHPFRIQSDSSTAYSTGVTNNNSSSGNIDFVPRNDAPARLYYNCTAHGGMLGNIYLRGAGGNETNVGIITATRFSGNGSSLTNLPAGNLTGTVADARISTLTASKLSGALPAISGASLTNLNGSAITSGTVAANRVATLNQSTTGNAATATAFSVTSNNTTNETVYPVFVDGNSGTQGAEVDTALTYNPSTNTLTTGIIDIGDANISSGTATISSAGNVDTTAAGSCSAIEYTIYASHSSGIQSQKVLIMDNGSTAYSNEFAVMFSSSLLISFSADLVGAAVRLRGTPESGISGNISIKFIKTIIE